MINDIFIPRLVVKSIHFINTGNGDMYYSIFIISLYIVNGAELEKNVDI